MRVEGYLPKTVFLEGRTEMRGVCEGCFDKRGKGRKEQERKIIVYVVVY